jgi:hypothetical protein
LPIMVGRFARIAAARTEKWSRLAVNPAEKHGAGGTGKVSLIPFW